MRVSGSLSAPAKPRESEMGNEHDLDNLTRNQWLQVYAFWAFAVACMILGM